MIDLKSPSTSVPLLDVTIFRQILFPELNMFVDLKVTIYMQLLVHQNETINNIKFDKKIIIQSLEVSIHISKRLKVK